MTPLQKQLVTGLMSGAYLMQKIRHDGNAMYKLYRGQMVPIRYYSHKTVNEIHYLLKRDRKSRYTLNLREVRRLNGNSWIKKLYLSRKKQTDERL